MRLPTRAWAMPRASASCETVSKLFDLRRNHPDRNGKGVVADVAVILDHYIEGDDVTVAQDAFQRANTVDYLFVNRKTGISGKPTITNLIAEASAASAARSDQFFCYLVQVVGADSRLHVLF